ncbi:MAG: hypothetical protein IKH95_00325 [Bacteroidaceae bacterium]|nr:hypothetical protein [Bacteroidaceae bacterium]
MKKLVVKYSITIGVVLASVYIHEMDVVMTEDEFNEYKKMSVEDFKKSKWFNMLVIDFKDKLIKAGLK